MPGKILLHVSFVLAYIIIKQQLFFDNSATYLFWRDINPTKYPNYSCQEPQDNLSYENSPYSRILISRKNGSR